MKIQTHVKAASSVAKIGKRAANQVGSSLGEFCRKKDQQSSRGKCVTRYRIERVRPAEVTHGRPTKTKDAQ